MKPPATTPIHVGAQNMHWLDQGAYTGETSPLMLKALGVTHVLIGHSERRQYFNETDESVNLKLKAALAHGLIPIVCVGEMLAEREADQTTEVLERQTSIALNGIDPAAATSLVIAYEPVWAIGTGRTADSGIADDAHKIIRAQIAKSLSPALAASTASSTVARSRPTTPPACAAWKTSTARWSAARVSNPRPSRRSSPTQRSDRNDLQPTRRPAAIPGAGFLSLPFNLTGIPAITSAMVVVRRR